MKIACVVLGSLLLGVLLGGFLKPATKVVTFDVHRVRYVFIQQLAEHKLLDLDVKAKSSLFNQSLKKVLSTYASEQKVMIFERESVLAGGEDVTDRLIPRIAKAMRGTS